MTIRVITGDCRDVLKEMASESVHCVVTSPPYWGLRDYGVAGQLGLESTLGEHIAVLVGIFREVRRVLRKDGTLWLNYGDCYATSPNGRSAADTKALGSDDRTFRDKPFSTVGPIYQQDAGASDRGGASGNKGNGWGAVPGGRVVAGGYLKPKDLCMMAARLAIALQEDGWWVRSDIIWHKPNPMPENATDRPTSSYEHIFMLTKSPRYHFDAESVQEAAISDHPSGNGFKREARLTYRNSFGEARGNPMQWEVTKYRNIRNVWTVATHAFPEAHFATFPPALIEPCIKAGCPAGGVVLDPFGGSGTTGLVADRLGRDAILIELNPSYAEMARQRVDRDCPLFVKTTA